MSKFTDESKDLFVNPKKRRTLIVILLIILIILILLLISRCTYDLAHGFSGIFGNYIGAETTFDGSGGDGTTEPFVPGTDDTEDDTTDTTHGGGPSSSDPTTSDTEPEETEPEDVGDEPLDIDDSIILRPFGTTDKVEFAANKMLPGYSEDISVSIESKFYQDRDLVFTLNVTKDETQWVNTELADVLTFTINFTNGRDTFSKSGKFSELDGQTFLLGEIFAYQSVRCDINVTMDKTAGNQYINSILEADFTWKAQ